MNYKIRYFLAAFLCLSLVIEGLLFRLYQSRINNTINELTQKEQFVVTLQKASLNSTLGLFMNDVLLLAEHVNSTGFRGRGAAGNETTLSALEEKFKIFSIGRYHVYDQLRYLDKQGDEIIRVNFKNGKACLVKDGNLQNKKNRYYFKDISKLQKRNIYISPLDLNVEDGRLERPVKPMLRMGTPLFDKQGRFYGAVIINYLGENIISAFNEPCTFSSGVNMLLNSNGYWLRNVDKPELEWAFMFDSTKHFSLKEQSPEIWETVTSGSNGQISSRKGILTYETIHLVSNKLNDKYLFATPLEVGVALIAGESRYWKIVSFISEEKLSQILQPLRRERLIAVCIAALINVVLSVTYASVRTKKQKAEYELKLSHNELELKVIDRTEELQHINEELKNINDEVYIVNCELESKNQELVNINNDVNNLLNSTDIGSLFLDAGFKIRKFTPAVKNIFKLSSADIGLSIEEFSLKIPEEIGKTIVAYSRKVMTTKGTYEKEFENYNGKFYLTRINPFITNGDSVEGVVISFVDITPIKKAQAEVIEKSNYLNAIYKAALTGIYIYNIQHQTNEYVNKRYTEVLGYTREEINNMLPDRFFNLFHPDDQPAISKHIEELSDIKEGQVYTIEYRFKAKDGSWKWCYSSDTGFEYKNGQLISFIGSFLDITSRKQTEQKIRENEARYRSLFHENKSVMLLVDAVNGNIVGANKAAAKYYGYSQARLKSMNVAEIDVLSKEEMRAAMHQSEKLGLGYYQFRHRLANNQIRYVKVYTSPVSVGDKELLYSIIHDNTNEIEVTEKLKKQTHELIQSEKMNVIGTFTAGIAHELNNPMMGILNYVDYCKKHVPEENRAYPILDDLKEEANRSAEIVKGLLSFVHKEKEDLHRGMCDVNEALKDCLKLIELKIKNTGIKIKLPANKLEYASKINPGHLQQVLLNILDNAVYAVKNTEIKIININFSEDKVYNIITITDSGIGISQKIYKDIFNPFYTTKPVGEGTGLGLSICKNILDTVGGIIKFQSEENKGTACIIKLLKNTKTTILHEKKYPGD